MFCAAWLLSARKCALYVVVVFGHMFRHLHVSWVFERHGLRVLHNGLLCEPCATRCTAMQGLSLSHVHGPDGRAITGRPKTPCKGPTSIFEFVFLVCVLLLYVCLFLLCRLQPHPWRDPQSMFCVLAKWTTALNVAPCKPEQEC